MRDQFIIALENKDLTVMRTIPKGDLHNHITRGGNKRYVEAWAGIRIPKCPLLTDLNHMNEWYAQYIKPFLHGRLGYEKRIEASFVQAKQDGVKILHMSVGIGEEIFYNGSVETLINAIKRIHNTYAPEITFIPEIAVLNYTPVEEISEKLDRFLEQDYFQSIDIYGNEYAVPGFKKVFRKAKDNGLILKAHVGEFGDADLVKKAVEELELDHVQHGIAAAQSKSVMNWLRDNNIQLNVCPTSNLLLRRVENYSNHPIRKLYDYGIKVTINTDDMLIFDQSVSEEYFNLYNNGVFNAVELNEIRENSLTFGVS